MRKIKTFNQFFIPGIILFIGFLLIFTMCKGNIEAAGGIIANEPDEPEEPGPDIPPPDVNIESGAVTIIEASGWLETFFVTWEKLNNTSLYNVYYRGDSAADWIKIDNPLIREYGDYYRADVFGIAAGIYEAKVLPVDGGGEESEEPAKASNILVNAHDRSGFAFNSGKIPGAYAMDGTPKTGARIIYITEQNKETVSMAVRNNTNNREETFSGLQNILTAYEKGYEDRPLIIRFIGRINEKKNPPFSDNEGSVMIKGNSSRPLDMNITLEGVGNDATAYGWGFRTSRANCVEIRNLGFMLSNTSQKDTIELQNSANIWVHNCDIFYGMPGGDSDQKKGDGSLDIKICDNITVSYNHFWDSGKTSLLGNGAEVPGRITYHHNWFDHCDSRHPRVRAHKAHVYNNFFDGIGKYGIGATMNSSIFAEANYFRNTQKPLLISMQGSDIADGSGTFSSENGGIIKAYNNYMDEKSANSYKPWSSSNAVEFDAYEVADAAEAVPDTVKAKKGGAVYDNGFLSYAYSADSPATAREKTMLWSGRYWRGDFSFAFAESDASLVDDPMPALLSALQNYSGSLVSVQMP
ncbi:MAG: hypothetical protein FWH38_03195 [Treponema sp.]|nr:hypothetical protein [Treponema sp.]